MDKDKRWEEAQATEVEFWDGMSRDDFSILRVLTDNAGKAPLLQSLLDGKIKTALEVGWPIRLGHNRVRS
jgi:hypothetical protein